jgi:hypothetical protein
MPEYDQRLMDLVADLRGRYPIVPSMKHDGVPVNELEHDDLMRLMVLVLDEHREMRAQMAEIRKQSKRRPR